MEFIALSQELALLAAKNFVEQTGKSLDDEYTAKQILNLVKGQFGAEKFKERINK